RPNLRVETAALAFKILFREKAATGIEYRKDNRTIAVQGKQIVICGGTFNSPQLLELSGIGRKSLLEEKGIPVVYDAPDVGEHLQDHFYVRTFWRCCKPVTLNDEVMTLWRKARMAFQYALFREGPLTVSGGHAGAFVRTRPELARPDAQIYLINFSALKRGGILHPHSGFTCGVSQLQVESRGSSHIQSSEAGKQPSIRYNYLA